jgi:DNA-binding SARP family transcriptional activator
MSVDLLEGEVAGDWLEEQLSGLRRLYLELALTLGATLEQNGQLETAIRLYQQLIARDDLQEEPHRRLIGRAPASGHARSNTTSAWPPPCAPRWMRNPSSKRSTSIGAS